MAKRADIICENDILLISGDLDCSNVMSVYEKSLSYLGRLSSLNFDFSKLTSNNSAAIALMIEWIKFAKQHHKTIQFTGWPSSLQSITEVAGLNNIIVCG